MATTDQNGAIGVIAAVQRDHREIEQMLAHAEHEERAEHPRIMQNEPPEKLERLTSAFETAEKTEPTRPHASAPESRSGNLVLGPILAVTDRVRDAVRDAMKH